MQMITPPVYDVLDVLPNFPSLPDISPQHLGGGHEDGDHVCGVLGVVVGEDGETKGLLTFPTDQTAKRSFAETLGTQIDLPAASPLIVLAQEYEDGFAEALDEATDKRLAITLVLRNPLEISISEALKKVERPESAPPVPLVVQFGEEDFDRCALGRWPWTPVKKEAEHNQLETLTGRFKLLGKGHLEPEPMTAAYRVGEVWVSVVLMRAYLESLGHPFQVIRDTADGEYGILTDYQSPRFRQATERSVVEQRMRLEAAEASGDELAAAFLLPAFDEGKTALSHDSGE